MCCATETYASAVKPRTALRLIPHSGGIDPRVTKREIHHARSHERDGSHSTATGVVPDSTKADPEHIWGDEGPVNE
jgi:hypothetical protein